MAKVDFDFRLAGLNEVMKSPEMQSVIDSAADQIAAVAGEGWEVERAHPIGFVAIGSVRATTFEARLDNSKNNTLEKAVGSVKI